MGNVEPTLDEWRALYDSAAAVQTREPWRLLSDEQLVAVKDPETGEVSYCSIMGAAGLEYGVLAHRGVTGLRAYFLTLAEASDTEELLLLQDCLSFTLGDADMLLPEDRRTHRALRLRFRGAGAWPIFRTLQPGLLPRPMTGQEARRTTACLEQICAFLDAMEEGEAAPAAEEVARRGEGFVGRARDDAGMWATAVFPLPEAPPGRALDVSRSTVHELRRAPLGPSTWEVATKVLAPIAERDGPAYWSWSILCVDHRSGMIMPFMVGGPEASYQALFGDSVRQAGVRPREILVRSPYLESRLRPLAHELGIDIQIVEFLDELEVAAAALDEQLLGPGRAGTSGL